MRRLGLSISLMLVSTFPVPSIAQTPAVAAALGHLNSPIDTIRQYSLSELTRAAQANHIATCDQGASPHIKGALIQALEAENARIFAPGGHFQEAETEFLADLIGCVASLHDQSAAQALADALDTGGGAAGGLLALGSDVTALQLQRISQPAMRVMLRDAALDLALSMSSPRSATPVSAAARTKLRSILMAAAVKDPWPELRQTAVSGLRFYPDPEIRALMQRIVATDTGTVEARGGRVKVVARAARAWLDSVGPKVGASPP